MIQLLPVTEPSMLERLNRIYSTQAKFAYVCVEKKEIKASCLYNIKGDCGEIVNVSSVEQDIFDGLVRAVFANMLELGIDKAVFDRKIDHEMLVRLGFVQDDGFCVNSLTKIIHKCKNCAGC